jgi:RNA recognition motif-containing protein
MGKYVQTYVQQHKLMKIQQLFASCGDIVEVRIMKDHVGASKGYGFVQFSSKKAVLKAQEEKNGKLVCILSSNPSLPFMAI